MRVQHRSLVLSAAVSGHASAAAGPSSGRDQLRPAGFRSTKQLLAGTLNLSPTEAGTRVAHAGQLAPRRALGGEVLAPLLPIIAAALAAGEIGPAQVRVITETVNAISTTVSTADRDAAEAELARHARSFNPTSLHAIGRHILAHLDPDGPEPRDEPELNAAAGELRFWNRRDGRLGLEGYLEPEHSAAFRTLIEQLATSRPATAGIPDPRTGPQRNADALLEICGLVRAGVPDRVGLTFRPTVPYGSAGRGSASASARTAAVEDVRSGDSPR
jgi:hypothetical protein